MTLPLRDHLEPLSVFLVKKGGSGDRLLFRYPYSEPAKKKKKNREGGGSGTLNGGTEDDLIEKNPYAAVVAEDIGVRGDEGDRLTDRNLINYPSKHLSNLFTVSPHLCGKKFELKVDDVRFVGHPLSLELTKEDEVLYPRYKSSSADSSMTMFNVVFALSTSATYSVVTCYHDLAMRLASAIKAEERSDGYLYKQSQIMIAAQDEVSSMPEEKRPSPFALCLQYKDAELARALKRTFDESSHTGYVDVRLNGWSEVLFCLPQKVHKKVNTSLLVEPEAIAAMDSSVRPYHALLLLQDKAEIIDELPLDYNTAVRKVVEEASPVKSFSMLSADTGLLYPFVFNIGIHLLYWGKATIIYPLCHSNVYVISPHVPSHLSPQLLERFAERFQPGPSLPDFLQLFSLPNSVAQALPPVTPAEERRQLAAVVVWCLQHHLLVQLHKFIMLTILADKPTILPDPLEEPGKNDRDEIPNRQKQQNDESSWPPLETVREAEATGCFGRRTQLLRGMGSKDELLEVFSEREREELLKIPASSGSNLDDLRLFVRLAPYFNGKYHVEEIMYHENVRRSQLLQVVDKFRKVLTIHETEDTNMTRYFSQSVRAS